MPTASLWRSTYHDSSGGVVAGQFFLAQFFIRHTPAEIVRVERTTQDQLVVHGIPNVNIYWKHLCMFM